MLPYIALKIVSYSKSPYSTSLQMVKTHISQGISATVHKRVAFIHTCATPPKNCKARSHYQHAIKIHEQMSASFTTSAYEISMLKDLIIKLNFNRGDQNTISQIQTPTLQIHDTQNPSSAANNANSINATDKGDVNADNSTIKSLSAGSLY